MLTNSFEPSLTNSFEPSDGQPPQLFTGDIEWTATCRSCHIGGAHTFMACGCFIYTIEENSFFLEECLEEVQKFPQIVVIFVTVMDM